MNANLTLPLLTHTYTYTLGVFETNNNSARAFIDNIRKRKGLPIEEKIVNFAEKQRTLNKKK